MNEPMKPKTNGVAHAPEQPQEAVRKKSIPIITNIAHLFKPKAKEAVQEALHAVKPEDTARSSDQAAEKVTLTLAPKDAHKP